MANFITRAQYDELSNAAFLDGHDGFHDLLEKYAGIEARPYTAYQYYDAAGNYVGDSNESGLDELLQAAYVEVQNG